MANLVNPYANPYLPSFVNQRPTLNQAQTGGLTQMSYSQIHSVKGFEGAEAYSLANGASEILAEEDTNLARIYVVAKDANGQLFVQGFDLTPVERPKPITMDDLNQKMTQVLDRLNKLEGERNGQSNSVNAWNGTKQPSNARVPANGRNDQIGTEPVSSNRAVSPKQS